MKTATQNYKRILQEIREWPTSNRISLVQDILRTISDDMEVLPKPRNTLSEALGLLASNDHPAPTDEQVGQWLDEHRMQKYGS